ncbi:hypothetical protein RA280_06970 [Cupriavidus sp. CV2]|uniref:hypothetical protein n=1 Tax=Cupriavidus ulmosensis TaxID=3065913 RepID=UPI00296AA05E|nr:hypothetical protein [Cupriavidus sp. CV2]MDW3681492.1 hypothetical protein [Cupriavidus sp. CV2]
MPLAVDIASGICISMRDFPFAVRAGLAPLGFLMVTGLAPAVAAQANAPASLSTLARLLLGTVDGRSTGMSGVTRLTGGVASSDAELNTACQELTRAGPFTLDAATRLEGCSVAPGKRVQFRLSLVGVDASREGTVAFMASARPVLERGICRNPDVPVLGRLGVTLNYRYAGIGNQPLGEVTITPDRCGPK